MRSVKSFCRLCHNSCAMVVEADGDVVQRVSGDRDDPVYRGYMCIKGRAYPEVQHSAARVLHPLGRSADGRLVESTTEVVLDEVAARLRRILDDHGPRAVALYMGTKVKGNAANIPISMAFMDAIDSPMRFTANTIDQPGKAVALGLHGSWMAPAQGFDEPDAIMLLGINPLVSYFGMPSGNPARFFSDAAARGSQLIVVDPRRTEIAKRAHIHLQPVPGEDVTILAGMIRVILDERRHDVDFVGAHVAGLDDLRRMVDPFTPVVVAARAKIDPALFVGAARTFGQARRGYAVAGTGPNMSLPGTLVEYLILALDTICGHWLRAGEQIANPGVLMPASSAKAQAAPPVPAYGFGEQMRVRGLADTMAGLPTAALADEILLPGDGQVRALISLGGNPVAAWPDQLRTIEAMKALDLLVQFDTRLSATAEVADYVIAAKTDLEMPGMTLINDMMRYYANGYGGHREASGQYSPAVVRPPEGSDVIEEWEFFWGVAERLGVRLRLGGGLSFLGSTAEPIELRSKPTTDDLYDMITQGSRIGVEELRRHPGGATFPDPPVVVAPMDEGWTGRLDVGNGEMMADLRSWADTPAAFTDQDLPFRLIARRLHHVMNSAQNEPGTNRGRAYNPAFLHPADLQRLGLRPGDLVRIRSTHAEIIGIAEVDADLRVGLVSMTHGFGGPPERDAEVAEIGSPTPRLCSVDEQFDRYTGQPLMSNIPVRGHGLVGARWRRRCVGASRHGRAMIETSTVAVMP